MTVPSHKGYAIQNTGAAGVKAARAYSIGSASGIRFQTAYAALSVSSSVSALMAYAVMANPASVTGLRAFALARNDQAVIAAMGYVILTSGIPPYEALDMDFDFADGDYITTAEVAAGNNRILSEARFPVSISYGSSGGPGFKTSIFTVDSGIAHANAEWDRLRARYSVDFDSVPLEDLERVEAFFYAMRGMAKGFRFKDWNDYQIVNQNVLIGDGVTKQFQLFKRYRSGPSYYDRPIKKPVRGTFSSIFLNGVEQVLNREFKVNYSNGLITFENAPPPGSVGFLPYVEFDVPVRFDSDEFMVSAVDHNQYSISGLDLIEILV